MLKQGVGLTVFLTVFFWMMVAAGGVQSENVPVYYGGEEIKLSLKSEQGRFLVLRKELIKLVPELFSAGEADGLEGCNREWVPLRSCWEEIGYQVTWLPELNAVVISKKINNLEVPEEALEVVKKAIADVDWLTMKTEEDLKAHLSKYYTPEIVSGLMEDTWSFIQTETDWHSLYEVIDAELLDSSENRCLLKVKITETGFPSAETTLFYGIVQLIQLESGWRIGAYHYSDGEL